MLLHLADSPSEKTRIEDLALLDQPTAPESLTWADIIRDDPLDNRDGIWDDVDFRGTSSESGEGSLLQDSDDGSNALSHSFVSVGDLGQPLSLDDHFPDFEALHTIRESRTHFIKASTNSESLTETQVIREALFMLHGLPSALFERLEDGKIWPKTKISIPELAAPIANSIVQALCNIGGALSTIRDFTAKAETVQVLQTLQSSLISRLREVDEGLSNIEQRIIEGRDSQATLAATLPEIGRRTSHFLLLIRAIPSEAIEDEKRCIFALEALHQLACEQQVFGDIDGFAIAAEVFFNCFQTYLRPLEEWMQEGALEAESESVFIRCSSETLPLSSLWSKQYLLVRDEHGNVLAPSFMQSLALSIFASGKAVNFSKALGETSRAVQPVGKSALTFASICKPSLSTICPFGELFSQALQQWVMDRQSLSSIHLKAKLNSKYNLYHALDALDHIYFGCNGSLTQHVGHGIFDRIDRGRRWQDKFALTDLYRDGLNVVTGLDEEKLSVRIVGISKLQELKHRSVLQLECLRITYELPWPLATIIRPASFSTYQRIHVLLLQLLRAKYLLHRQSSQLVVTQKFTDNHKFGLHLRHKMYWFVETVQSYILKEVLEPMALTMRSEMHDATDIDSMISIHENNLTRAEILCLLANQQHSTHRALVSILDLVVSFSDTCSTSIFRTPIAKDDSQTTADSDLSEDDEEPGPTREPSLESLEELQTRLSKILTTYTRLLQFVFMGARDASRSQKGSALQKLVDVLKFGMTDP